MRLRPVQWIDLAGWIAAVLLGGAAVAWDLYGDPGLTFAGQTPMPTWHLDAFSGFGTMSGFALASLALTAALAGHPRGRLLDEDGGRDMVRAVLVSTFTWLAPGVAALAHMLVRTPILLELFVFTAVVAVVRGAVALYAFGDWYYWHFAAEKPK